MESGAQVNRTIGAAAAADGEPHPKIARLIAHWRSLAPGPGLLPGRQHFDPLRVHDLMPHLWLIDVLPEHPRYRIRLVGGALVDAGVRIRHGEFFHDAVPAEEAERARNRFDRIVADKQIDWKRGPSAFEHMRHVHALERVFLPLAADGVTVDMLLCMSLFYWTDGRIY
jgi:hypothetical protein